MALWNKTSKKPSSLSRKDKRNVMATDKGWVSRIGYQDVHGKFRNKEEILVPLAGLANSTNMGTPDIDDIWHSISAGATGVVVNTWVSFNEPIQANSNMRLTVANTTATGSPKTAITANTKVYGSNKLLFRWTAANAGIYKVQAQTIANSSAQATFLKSTNAGSENVSLVISGPVSNTSGLVTIT